MDDLGTRAVILGLIVKLFGERGLEGKSGVGGGAGKAGLSDILPEKWPPINAD